MTTTFCQGRVLSTAHGSTFTTFSGCSFPWSQIQSSSLTDRASGKLWGSLTFSRSLEPLRLSRLQAVQPIDSRTLSSSQSPSRPRKTSLLPFLQAQLKYAVVELSSLTTRPSTGDNGMTDPPWTLHAATIPCWPPSSCSLVMLLGLRVRRATDFRWDCVSLKQNNIRRSVKLGFPALFSIQTPFYPTFRLEVSHAFLSLDPECLGGN